MLYIIGIAYARAHYVLTHFRFQREMESAYQLMMIQRQVDGILVDRL